MSTDTAFTSRSVTYSECVREQFEHEEGPSTAQYRSDTETERRDIG
jgi:hypothetical protein